MAVSVQEKAKVSPFLVFFLVHSMQMGIGVLGFQRIIAYEAGFDSWMSVIFAGLMIHPIVWIIYKLCDIGGGDLVAVHEFTFGKRLGKLLSLPFALYYTMLGVTTLRTFIEIVQVWMFQTLSTFWFSAAYILLAIYIVYGGFRTVAGISFFGVVLPFYLVLIFVMVIPFTDFRNLLPIFDHSIKQLLLAAYNMSLTYIGWEALLVYYPYIKNAKSSQKWAQAAIFFTMAIYVYIAVLSFAYFSEGQLQRNIWASLSMFKIVQMPFVERFEYIGIASWSLIILPNICLGIWAGTRILRRTYHVKQKYGVIGVSIVSLIALYLLQTREQINTFITYTGRIGFYFNFAYLPFLFIITFIVYKVKGRADSPQEDEDGGQEPRGDCDDSSGKKRDGGNSEGSSRKKSGGGNSEGSSGRKENRGNGQDDSRKKGSRGDEDSSGKKGRGDGATSENGGSAGESKTRGNNSGSPRKPENRGNGDSACESGNGSDGNSEARGKDGSPNAGQDGASSESGPPRQTNEGPFAKKRKPRQRKKLSFGSLDGMKAKKGSVSDREDES